MMRVMPETQTRTRLQVDERRAQLLVLGLRLFSERSYDEVSIDDIAREASVSKGLLYHYFGGKRAFYVACVEYAAGLLLDRIAPDLSLPEPERAQAGLEAYLDFVDEHDAAYLALMRSGIGNDPEVAAILERTRSTIVRRMLDGMGLDESRAIFRTAARSWIGQVEAASVDHLDHRDLSRERLVRLLMSSLLGIMTTAQTLEA